MKAAYAGGVEDVGQDEAWHAQEAHEVLGGAYGPVLHAASTWVHKGEDALAATVVTDWQEVGETLLAFALCIRRFVRQHKAKQHRSGRSH